MSSGRIAGGVLRYHTWPTLRRQTVAEHTWHSLRIYMETFGPPPPHVSVAITTHDMGELATGDLPFPVKKDNAHVATAMSELEGKSVDRTFGSTFGGQDCLECLEDMTTQDKVRVKICDILEMIEFGMEERLMGNRYADPIVEDMMKLLGVYSDKLGCNVEAHRVQRSLDRMYDRYKRGMSDAT